MSTQTTTKNAKPKRSKYKGIDHLSPVDRVVVSLMVGVPTLLVLWLVVAPAIGSVLLSFTNWDGIGPLSGIKSVGLQNYRDIATNDKADQAAYTSLQKKSVEFVSQAKSIAQFMDRDTRPDFASTVMIPAIQSFIKNPKDIDGLVNGIEKQKQSIFAS